MKQTSPFINLLINIIVLLNLACFAQNRISQQKCIEYQSSCPKESSVSRLNGSESTNLDFPHMAYIGFGSENNDEILWACAGTLISENFIISVAQCLDERPSMKAKLARIGVTEQREFKIIKTFVHPSHIRGQYYNELVLHKINESIIFNEFIRPACLRSLTPNKLERVNVTNWAMAYEAKGSDKFGDLEVYPKKTISHSECNRVLENRDRVGLPNGIENSKQICARRVQNEEFGGIDYGAPLTKTVNKESCLHEIYGLNSIPFSYILNYPDVYIRVAAFLDWIENIVWIGGNGTSSEAPPSLPVPLANRTHIRKCHEYHNHLFSQNGRNNQCVFSVSYRIVDGREAEPKEFPHMALVGFDGLNTNNNDKITWGCGGSLISEKFVLTAAHCLNNSQRGPAKYVLLGDLDYSRDDDDAQPLQINVAQHIKYPTYTTRYKYNDIGLLRLETSVTFNAYIWPACLPEFDSFGFQAKATGWGRLDNNGSMSTSLRKVDLDLYTHTECDTLYAFHRDRKIERGILYDTQLCAGSRHSRGDTCDGDSGGPLQTYHYNLSCMYTVEGITSFGLYCGIPVPSVYTRVYSYVDWIENVVWPN